MNQTLNVPVSLLDNVVEFIELSSLTTKRALDELGAHRHARSKAAALCPDLVDHMLRTRVVPVQQKQAAQAMLASHDTTLQLLKAAIDKIAELDGEVRRLRGGDKSAGDLGAGVDGAEFGGGPSADYNSLTSPFVGARTSYVKESDIPLLRLAGLVR